MSLAVEMLLTKFPYSPFIFMFQRAFHSDSFICYEVIEKIFAINSILWRHSETLNFSIRSQIHTHHTHTKWRIYPEWLISVVRVNINKEYSVWICVVRMNTHYSCVAKNHLRSQLSHTTPAIYCLLHLKCQTVKYTYTTVNVRHIEAHISSTWYKL